MNVDAGRVTVVGTVTGWLTTWVKVDAGRVTVHVTVVVLSVEVGAQPKGKHGIKVAWATPARISRETI